MDHSKSFTPITGRPLTIPTGQKPLYFHLKILGLRYFFTTPPSPRLPSLLGWSC